MSAGMLFPFCCCVLGKLAGTPVVLDQAGHWVASWTGIICISEDLHTCPSPVPSPPLGKPPPSPRAVQSPTLPRPPLLSSSALAPGTEAMSLVSCSKWGFPGGSDSRESACNVGDLDSVSGLGISPGGRNGNPHSVMSDSATAWAVARQVPLSMEFSRQETGVGSHSLPQGIFLTQGIKPRSSLAWRMPWREEPGGLQSMGSQKVRHD